jgi:hypothetical protein
MITDKSDHNDKPSWQSPIKHGPPFKFGIKYIHMPSFDIPSLTNFYKFDYLRIHLSMLLVNYVNDSV